MDNSKVETLKEALVEVRKAHRLVYSFQERMLSLVYYIGNKLDLGRPTGIKRFSNPIGGYRGRAGLKIDNGMWAWDFVYSYVFEYYFDEAELPDGAKYMLSIVQFADTGYFDSNAKDCLDITHFANPDSSMSKLLFILEKHPKGKSTDYMDLGEYIHNKEYASKQHTRTDLTLGKNRLLLYSIPLERFADEKTTLNALQEYLAFLKSKDLEIELV